MVLPPVSAVTDPADTMYAWCRRMLDTQPVHLNDKQQCHVFSYADVARVISDPSTFSSDFTPFSSSRPELEEHFKKGAISRTDPPRHHKLRALINQAFTPRMVAALAPRITEITISLLDAVHGADRFDLVDSLAHPLPITVIAELLGIPTADQPRFRAWGEVMHELQVVDATTLAGQDEEPVNTLVPTMRDMSEYLLAHTRRHRQQPTDGLISKLVTAEIDGEQLSDEYIAGFSGELLSAGHVPTTALLGNAVFSFDRHPEAAAALRADGNLVPAAIEEVLRYRPPAPRLFRTTTTDTEIGGHALRAGQLVILWIAAANRDPARFPDPNRFDVHRTTTGQLAFGHGIHFCIAASLARLETKIALGVLFDRYQDITVDTKNSSIEFYNPWHITAVKQLPMLVA
jgi:cytochrome P450